MEVRFLDEKWESLSYDEVTVGKKFAALCKKVQDRWARKAVKQSASAIRVNNADFMKRIRKDNEPFAIGGFAVDGSAFKDQKDAAVFILDLASDLEKNLQSSLSAKLMREGSKKPYLYKLFSFKEDGQDYAFRVLRSTSELKVVAEVFRA